MAKNDPLSDLDKTPKGPVPMPGDTQNQQLNDLHDHLVRLQKQVNEQGKLIESLQATVLSLQESRPVTATLEESSFESKVWETVLVGALSAALGPNKVLQDTPKAMQQIISRAIRLAEAGVDAAKEYQREQELNRQAAETAKNNDPLKQLIGAV